MNKTTMARKETAKPNWYVVDGDGHIVGRFATKLATVLMGKHKPEYTPHVDCGDCVIVVNAHLVRFTGDGVAHPNYPYMTEKTERKTYERYSGYPSGRKILTGKQVWESHPDRILSEAVRRMLPKTKLGKQMLTKLYLYNEASHPHQAQQPEPLPEYLLKYRRDG